MTIEQTVTIPTDRRVSLEFLAPPEIPVGSARIELKVIPVIEKQDTPTPDSSAPIKSEDRATPLTDALSGILSHLGDVSLKEIREERLARHLR